MKPNDKCCEKESSPNRNVFLEESDDRQNSKEVELDDQELTLTTPFIFGGSVTGRSHIQFNIPCQDSYAFKILPSGECIIAVADGLGSAKKSEIGAKTAVKTAIEVGESIITEKKNEGISYDEVLREIIISSRSALETQAIEDKCSLRDLACTIIVVLFLESDIFVAHIGDGAVVAKTREELILISEPEETEYVNEVVPLTSEKWDVSLRITSKISNIECVAVFTDGCQWASLSKTQKIWKPYEGFFNPLFEYAQELEHLEQGESEVKELLISKKLSETSEDDKTLLILVAKRKRAGND
jgi:hypothetical protein